MLLRGIDVGCAFVSSGALGFFGDGYAYHHVPPWRYWAAAQDHMTFVAKTTTLHPRAGNMPLDWKYDPRELFPRCIVVDFRQSFVLNAVGLSGPGAQALFEEGPWFQRTKPFFLSFMAVGKRREDRLQEAQGFVSLFSRYRSLFKTSVGLEINISCPNVGHQWEDLIHEAHGMLDTFSVLDIPLVPNVSAVLRPQAARGIAEHPACDAVSVANSIPFGEFPERINWKKLFGTLISPLERRGFGPGGLSGKPIYPVTLDWLEELQDARYRFPKPLIIGGGIQDGVDAERVLRAGFPAVRAVKYGTGFLLRPWNAYSVVQAASTALDTRALHGQPYPYRA
jgi:dihydroorotate dehydrogenase